MTSFLDKLNGKLNGKGKPGAGAHLAEHRADSGLPDLAPSAAPEEALTENQRLDVDVYFSPTEVVIYALAGGADPAELDISLDEENDVLTIRGSRKRPEVKMKQVGEVKELEGKFLNQEVKWEPFYRKIVLPTEVDAVKAEAVLKQGLLVITLPLLNVAEGRKLKVVEILSASPPSK